ncbi:GMP synthase [Sulfodiicoccus acidiphilus]|uniref:GMP synthase n=1 Tax=Sulfodiicoccus acidiphilus TaxID=1670455 RepID=A0A348B3L6_9CREN|nr:glutamine-hydrolyzing GMP synthase [Sulfodiicoccus acidiphilus]BBD72768.1 GMP synthase [Sulfodiicoccus acidiphilus]GGT99651.1 GMP synthase [Sulfodiicoccus acidiphilus]
MRVGLVYFGGQYNHLIMKVLEWIGVEVTKLEPHAAKFDDFDAIVLSGGPQSVYEGGQNVERISSAVRNSSVPLLGICFGHQLIAHALGGRVNRASTPEFGLVKVRVIEQDTILSGFTDFSAWESHNDEVIEAPPGFIVLAESDFAKVQAMAEPKSMKFGVQFHPEVKHTEGGTRLFENFVRAVRK